MKTYYGLIARGQTVHVDGGERFTGLNGFTQTEAEDRVQAFLNIYHQLSAETSDISALKRHWAGEKFMLGFTDEEWSEVSQADIRIKEGYPDAEGIQIQAISETPFC